MVFKARELLAAYHWLAPSQTERLNHEDCPAGVDTRARLYVTRSSDGTKLKVYCHNCSKGTVINVGGPPLRSVIEEEEPEVLTLPPRMHPLVPLTDKHRRLLEAYGILGHAEERDVYSKSEHELVFPVEQSELQGYQIRYTDGRKDKWKSRGDPVAWWGSGKLYMVCEDIVSAYKWHEATRQGYVSAAGNRVSLSVGFGVFHPVVWYDNDKPQVVDNAKKLIRHLATKKVGVLITGGTDPKRYTKDELKKVADVCNQLVLTAPPDGGSYHVLEIRDPGKGVCP